MISLNGNIGCQLMESYEKFEDRSWEGNESTKNRKGRFWVHFFPSPRWDTHLGFTMICGAFCAVLSCLGAWMQLWNPSRLTPEDYSNLNVWGGLWLKTENLPDRSHFHVKSLPLHTTLGIVVISSFPRITSARLLTDESMGIMEYWP